ncbi:hypothetical protein D3C86_1814670 [compost metagenome]
MEQDTSEINSSSVSATSPAADPISTATAADLQSEIDKKKAAVQNIKTFEVDVLAALIKENPNSSSVTNWKESLTASNAKIDNLNNEIIELEKQLAELQQ